MSQVLARKYRPRSLTKMVGQDHLVKTLTHALEQKRLHHAYLFTGTRGVGKTSVARILAKCLNCETGVSPTPCDKCDICLAIDAGNFIDLLEIDAASRTKVEDTRELLDNVPYAPTRGRYKIYLIDEVHMLSGHSFNALLKTLEEPPDHVIFLLATTDPQRVPITVLSRCLQFHLKNMSPETIAPHLQHLLETEKIPLDQAAINRISIAANGSMRDALSLLDQAIAYGNGQVLDETVRGMLGSVEHDELYQILEALAQQDKESLYQALQKLHTRQNDYGQALEELLSLIHHVCMRQTWAQFPTGLFDAQKIDHLAKTISADNLQLFYQIALVGRRDLPFAATSKSGFEMIILRMLAFEPANTNTPIKSEPNTSTRNSVAKSSADKNLTWEALWPKLGLSGMSTIMAQHCVAETLTAQQVNLLLHPSQSPLLQSNSENLLINSIQKYFGQKTKVQIKLAPKDVLPEILKKEQAKVKAKEQTMAEISQDENIQALLSTFNAKIEVET